MEFEGLNRNIYPRFLKRRFVRCLNMKYAQHLQNFTPPAQGSPPCLFSTKPVLESHLAKFRNWGDHKKSFQIFTQGRKEQLVVFLGQPTFFCTLFISLHGEPVWPSGESACLPAI